jgi:hypothetical protein
MSSGTTCVHLQIARTDFSSGLGGAFHYDRGYSERLCTMPNSSTPAGSIGAPLTAFAVFTMQGANSAPDTKFGAPLVAAGAPLWLRSMREANSSLDRFEHPSWLQRLPFPPCETQTPPLAA